MAITGAGSGIGRALAELAARRGAHLALADVDPKGLAETRERVSGSPGRVSTHVVDVADEAAVRTFAAAAVSAHGGVDVLVNNAGVALYGSVLEIASDEFAWLMNVNFWGVVYGVKAFLPALLQRPEAAIVNVSSLFGLWAPPGQSAYAASKFAVRGFGESLRGELLDTNVHVMTVHPAGIATAIARSARVAAAVDPAVAAARTKAFEERFLTIAPADAASAILDGLERKRDRLLIGREARRVDVLTRLLGPHAARLFARRV